MYKVEARSKQLQATKTVLYIFIAKRSESLEIFQSEMAMCSGSLFHSLMGRGKKSAVTCPSGWMVPCTSRCVLMSLQIMGQEIVQLVYLLVYVWCSTPSIVSLPVYPAEASASQGCLASGRCYSWSCSHKASCSMLVCLQLLGAKMCKDSTQLNIPKLWLKFWNS